MAEQSIVQRMAGFAHGLQLDRLDSEVIARAKVCILDALECCISSDSDVRKTGALASVPKDREGQRCVLFGTGSVADAPDAAFYNGVSGAISSRNDISRIAKSHPGSVLIPAVFAVAEEEALSGRRVLEGILVGYETTIRVGNALRLAGLPSTFRFNAYTGPIGAAFAVARAQGQGPDGIANSASFAVHSASGLMEWAWAGTGEDVFQNGWAARNGVFAAALGKAGVPGAASIFEGKCGFLAACNATEHAGALTETLGERYHILDVRFKEISACIMVQTAGQTALAIARDPAFAADAVDRVEIEVSGQAMGWPGCDNTQVDSLVQAIMSIQFTVAQALVTGDCANIRWAPPYPDTVHRLMKRCTLRENPNYTKTHYDAQAAAVTVHMKDGRVLRNARQDVETLTEAQVTDKFTATMGRHFGPQKAAQLLDMVDRLETLDSIRPLTALLRG